MSKSPTAQPIPNPAKAPQIDGALVTPNQGGAANWPPPSFSPQTGLFYINASRGFSVYYIYDEDDKPEGWGGNDRGGEEEFEHLEAKPGPERALLDGGQQIARPEGHALAAADIGGDEAAKTALQPARRLS